MGLKPKSEGEAERLASTGERRRQGGAPPREVSRHRDDKEGKRGEVARPQHKCLLDENSTAGPWRGPNHGRGSK